MQVGLRTLIFSEEEHHYHLSWVASNIHTQGGKKRKDMISQKHKVYEREIIEEKTNTHITLTERQ